MFRFVALIGALLLGIGGFTAAHQLTSTATAASPYTHVVWVVMENHSYSQIIGNTASAPYINSLAKTYGNATQMFAESHPSLPNYIALTSGSTQGITDDSGPGSHPLNVANLFTQSGLNGRALEESMPSNCDKSGSGNYAVRHDPAVYYTNFSQCSTQVVPLGSTPNLSARFTFITPNLCHDMHSNTCTGSSNVILQGDTWLKSFVPQLLASPQYAAGSTAIFITWDEDNTCSGCTNHVPTIVISPTTKAVSNSTRFTHYSMLRTTEELLGQPLIGGAQTASSMGAAFNLAGSSTTTTTSTTATTATTGTTTATTTATTTTGTTTTSTTPGWTNVVNDQFDSGGVPAHWILYHSPYGSLPRNCTSPTHDFVSGGYLHLVERYETSTPSGVSCPYGAGWYTGGMKLDPVAPYAGNDQRVTVRYRIVSSGGVISHHIIPMRWPTGITYVYKLNNGEEDFLETDYLTQGRTFLHYATSAGGFQIYSPLYTIDLTQWHTLRFTQRNHTVYAYFDDLTTPVWKYVGNSTTIPNVLRSTVLQQECNHSTGCPTGTSGMEDIQIDWITVDNAS